MAFSIEGWYDELNKEELIVRYKGIVTASLITKLLEEVENGLYSRNEKSKLRKKIYNVVVEALQNLFHHTDSLTRNNNSEKNEEKNAIFVLNKDLKGNYVVNSGNFIDKARVKFLKDRLDQINYLNPAELKILYQLILNNDEYSDKGGGGLGLVDIAKRTGHEFEYSFNKFEDGRYFFCLKILITI